MTFTIEIIPTDYEPRRVMIKKTSPDNKQVDILYMDIPAHIHSEEGIKKWVEQELKKTPKTETDDKYMRI